MSVQLIKKNIEQYSIIVGILFVYSMINCNATIVYAQSASLFFEPSIGTYVTGEPFTVDVRVNTGGHEVGTADATLVFDPDDVTFISVSDEGSVFSTISVDSTREEGKIDLSGMITKNTPAFSGSNGLFVRVTFIPKRNTTAQLHFEHGAATTPLSPLGASVGSLKNILSSLQVASYNFIPKQEVVANVLHTSPVFADEGIGITPLPLPQGEWFATTTVTLSWTIPDGAVGMKTLVATDERALPTKLYDTPVSTLTIKELAEGKQYFLLQFNVNDVWGEVMRYPLFIDIKKPGEISIKETERTDPSDPHVSFAIDAIDEESGLWKYEMSIDGAEPVVWEKKENELYKPEGLTPGEHVLTAVAYDYAGNTSTDDLIFLVQSLEAPALSNESVPERVLTGDVITVSGSTYPNSEVTVFISYNDGEATEKNVKSDASGIFTVTIADGARAGKYTLWFMVTDERGAMSPNSIKRSIEVSQPYIMLFGTKAVTYLSVIVPLIALVGVLVLIVWLMYTWIHSYRKRVRKETNEAYLATHEEFDRLRQELIRQIGMLEKANQSRELTREEMRIFADLSKRLDKMEERIAQEIRDVEYVRDVEQPERKGTIVQGSLEQYRKKINIVDGGDVDPRHIVRL